MPKFAIANGLAVGPVPAEMMDMSRTEQKLIAKAINTVFYTTATRNPNSITVLQSHSQCTVSAPGKIYQTLTVPPRADTVHQFVSVVITSHATPA